MNILLLGNGFDLYYKLPTKYQNFLNVVDFLTKRFSPGMSTVGKVIGNRFLRETDSFIDGSYQKYGKVYDSTDLELQSVDFLISSAKENIWYQYLIEAYNRDVGWIDFEKEIGKVCEIFTEFFSATEEAQKGEKLKYNLNTLNISSLSYHVLKNFFKFFFDDLGELDDNYVPEYFGNSIVVKEEYAQEVYPNSKYKNINKEKIVGVLEDALNQLSKMLQIYLHCFVENVFKGLVSSGSVKDIGIHTNSIITFNYTKTYELLNSKKKVIHLHGATDSHAILGINPDDNDEIASIDTTFISFKKYYQRVFWGTDLDYLNCCDQITKFQEIDGYELNLYIMGHSLDVTDKDIIMELFKNATAITILCHSQSAVAGYISNLIKIYGKTNFDFLRSHKSLRFRMLDTDLEAVQIESGAEEFKLGLKN